MAFLATLTEEWQEEARAWPAAVLSKGAHEYAKNLKEYQAEREAEKKAREEEEEKDRLERLELHELHRLREQQQAAACENGCVCVCAYGFSRKRHLSAMGSPLVSRNVSTFNANV